MEHMTSRKFLVAPLLMTGGQSFAATGTAQGTIQSVYTYAVIGAGL